MKNNYNNKYKIFAVIAVLCFIYMAGCDNTKKADTNITNSPITIEDFKLNTVISISIYDSKKEELLNEAMDICDKYEKICSRTLETSELYQLNHGLLTKIEEPGNSYIVSEELADVLQFGLYYSKLSKGAFDITIAPVTSLWDFAAENPTLPEEPALQVALTKVNYKDLTLDGNKVTFEKDGMSIDLGAIAKGYIADRIKDYLIEQGVASAIINLGGNVLTIGEKPSKEAFKIGIQKPFADRNEVVASMDIQDLSVVSSGIYERYFQENGMLYHHIMNPSTGYPYDNGLVSVTIVSKKSVDGDGLSTTCFALGLEEGMKLIESLPDTYAIFITEDYKLHYTEGFMEHIEVNEVQ